MPRLIDADEVIKSIEMQIKLVRGIHSQDDVFQQFATIAEQSWKQEIANAPTVEAIPVEWIKERYGWLTMAHEIIKEWERENAKAD